MTVKVRFIFRLPCITGCLLYGMAEVFFLFPFYSNRHRLRAIRLWSLRVLASCGVKLQTFGIPPQENRGQMFIGSHISWLNIVVVNGAFPGRFVAEDDMAKWPMIGRLATQTQTVYVSRNRDIKGSSAKVAGITEALKNGDTVTIFPKGTNTEGCEILPSKPNFFQTAYDAGVPIIPALCCYPNPDSSSPNPHIAYYGDINPWQSVYMIISQSSSTVELHFPDSIEAGEDRYATALQVHALLSGKQKQLGWSNKRPSEYSDGLFRYLVL